MKKKFNLSIDERLDVYLAKELELTRSYLKNLIDSGKILVNGKKQKAGWKLK